LYFRHHLSENIYMLSDIALFVDKIPVLCTKPKQHGTKLSRFVSSFQIHAHTYQEHEMQKVGQSWLLPDEARSNKTLYM